jgi:hypothetical protein
MREGGDEREMERGERGRYERKRERERGMRKLRK